jgi:hypothetical protein
MRTATKCEIAASLRPTAPAVGSSAQALTAGAPSGASYLWTSGHAIYLCFECLNLLYLHAIDWTSNILYVLQYIDIRADYTKITVTGTPQSVDHSRSSFIDQLKLLISSEDILKMLQE